MSIEIDPATGAPVIPSSSTTPTDPPKSIDDVTKIPPAPTTSTPTKVTSVKSAPATKSAKEQLHQKITHVLHEYGGESNIPTGHLYWDWKNQYRLL